MDKILFANQARFFFCLGLLYSIYGIFFIPLVKYIDIVDVLILNLCKYQQLDKHMLLASSEQS